MKIRDLPKAASLACATVLLFDLGAAADEIRRSNWLPNVGDRFVGGEQSLPLGDMWTFRCPPGGSFSVRVDTRDDTDEGRSRIDPVLEVVDGNGNGIVGGDDEVDCTFEPLCGFRCPEAHQPCGEGDRHSLIIRDFGPFSATGDFCEAGGGYDVFLMVFLPDGRELSEVSSEFGGGAFRRLPRWVTLNEPAVGSFGPLLDDEDVPNMMNITK